MQGAGVPLFRFAVKREYDPQEIHQVLCASPAEQNG